MSTRAGWPQTTLSTELSRLTEAEAHALSVHLRYAAEESFAANSGTDTVRELDGLSRYLSVARKHVLGTGRKPQLPTQRHDSAEYTHESVLGQLDSAERSALAVHMDAAQREYRDAGGQNTDMLLDLIGEAAHAQHAATAVIRPSGLMEGRTR